jgi:hypothetical protein
VDAHGLRLQRHPVRPVRPPGRVVEEDVPPLSEVPGSDGKNDDRIDPAQQGRDRTGRRPGDAEILDERLSRLHLKHENAQFALRHRPREPQASAVLPDGNAGGRLVLGQIHADRFGSNRRGGRADEYQDAGKESHGPAQHEIEHDFSSPGPENR